MEKRPRPAKPGQMKLFSQTEIKALEVQERELWIRHFEIRLMDGTELVLNLNVIRCLHQIDWDMRSLSDFARGAKKSSSAATSVPRIP